MLRSATSLTTNEAEGVLYECACATATVGPGGPLRGCDSGAQLTDSPAANVALATLAGGMEEAG